MRTTPWQGVTIGALLVVAVSAGVLPSVADARGGEAPRNRVVESASLDLEPSDGSTNMAVSDGRLELGQAPARAGSAGVRQRFGIANLKPVRFDGPISAISVAFGAVAPEGSQAFIDVRSSRGNGAWTEWTPARPGGTTQLAEASDVVQARVVLVATRPGANPSVSAVTVEPVAAGTADAPVTLAEPVRSQVFATREGLVGGTTANGHVIVERDHFVALPSRRGLSDNNDGTYSVEVCANGRCIYEPVWDLGPWNIQDDYWSPSDQREMWQDLPQGLPEAQAAYEDGYNGGLDGYGREVLNPAGIDLADGAFWDGLGLSDNSWVDVAYLWTGDGAYGVVDASALNVRNGPSSADSIVGMAGNYAHVPALCQVEGETVTGTQGTTNLWLMVRDDMYVSKAYVAGGDAPAC